MNHLNQQLQSGSLAQAAPASAAKRSLPSTLAIHTVGHVQTSQRQRQFGVLRSFGRRAREISIRAGGVSRL
jgi:hypothetical protein